MTEKKWKPVKWEITINEGMEEASFKATIPEDGLILLLFSDGTYAGINLNRDLGGIEEKKKAEGFEVIDRITMTINLVYLLAIFLRRSGYDFGVSDLRSGRLGIFDALREKNALAYDEFQKFRVEFYSDWVQAELKRHPYPNL